LRPPRGPLCFVGCCNLRHATERSPALKRPGIPPEWEWTPSAVRYRSLPADFEDLE
jgi:hypothetical protein